MTNMMERIKFVINELNKPPFNQNLNLIGYDNLRDEQRLDLLIQILNVIDPKVNLPSVRLGNIEEIVTSILDMLRIFKYTPPSSHLSPVQFRKDLILSDRELLTDIFEWLLKQLPALKKRSYLARFLVKIELSPEVEGDGDVMTLYKQYENLIEDFKQTHSGYETQKKSLESIIELQRDIKTMELEKDQIKNKLDIVRRRVVDFDQNYSMRVKFDAVKEFVAVRHENEKLQRQLREQNDKIDTVRSRILVQQSELAELSASVWNDNESHHQQSPEIILNRFKDEIDIKQRLVKDVLPNELSDIRLLVRDIESIGLKTDQQIKDQLSKTQTQVQQLNTEINDLMEQKLMEKENDEDHLSHFRQNAQTVAAKKDETVQRCSDLEKIIEEHEKELEQLRMQFNNEDHGTVPLRADVLKFYNAKIATQNDEMEAKKMELKKYRNDIEELKSKLNSLKHQEKLEIKDINEHEEFLGINGYYLMKQQMMMMNVEHDLNSNKQSIDDERLIDFEKLEGLLQNFQHQNEKMKNIMAGLVKEVRSLRQQRQELDNDYNMKKRLYDSAAAGLEAELSRFESQFDLLTRECDSLESENFEIKIRLNVAQVEQSQLTGEQTASKVIEQLEQEIDLESKLQIELEARDSERQSNEEFVRRQIDMWRDSRSIFEIKSRILAQKQQDSNKQQQNNNLTKDHLVIE